MKIKNLIIDDIITTLIEYWLFINVEIEKLELLFDNFNKIRIINLLEKMRIKEEKNIICENIKFILSKKNINNHQLIITLFNNKFFIIF